MKRISSLIVTMVIFFGCNGDKSSSINDSIKAGVLVSVVFGKKTVKSTKEVLEVYKSLKGELDFTFDKLPKEGIGELTGRVEVKDVRVLQVVQYLVTLGGKYDPSLVAAKAEIEKSKEPSQPKLRSFKVDVSKAEDIYTVRLLDAKDLSKKE